MNKKILLGIPLGIIALGAAAYAGASWYTGTQVEKSMNAGIGELKAAGPWLKISEVKVKRGFFRTEHEMTLGLNADCFVSGMSSHDPKTQEELDKMKIRLRHTISHGPLSFANGIQPALASYEGRFVFDEKTAQELKKVLGDKPVLSWSGVIQFDGTDHFKLQSPAFDLKEKGNDITWAGIQGEGQGNFNNRSYKFALRAPKLEIRKVSTDAGDTGKALIENMQLAAEGQPGASKVGIGTASFSVGKLQFVNPLKGDGIEMSQVSYVANVKESGQFIDVMLAYRIAGMIMDAEKKKIGPAALELSLDHLHAPTLLAFDKSMKQFMCANPDQKPEMVKGLMDEWKQLVSVMLQNKPVLQLQQVKLGMPEGEISGKGKISIDGFEPAMLESPQAAMAALPGVVQIEFSGQSPEKLIMSSFRDFALKRGKRQMMLMGGGDMAPEKLKALEENADQDAKQQLSLAIAQNYVKQEGEQLTFSFSFSKGQAKLNGTPIPLPFLPQAEAAPMSMPPGTPAAPGMPPARLQ